MMKVVAMFLRFLNTEKLLDTKQAQDAIRVVRHTLPLCKQDFYRPVCQLLRSLQVTATPPPI